MACLLAASLGAAGPRDASAQQRLSVAGTTVSLVAPAGFAAATGFAGLANSATQASVLVVELPPAAHPQLATLFGDKDTAKASFAKQNVTIAASEAVKLANGETAPVLTGTQAVGAGTFDKWIALYKGPRTVMITVQAPQAAKLPHATVVSMFSSVVLGSPPTTAEKVAALPFAITTTAPFRIIDTLGGSGVMMMAGERDVDPSGSQPLLIAAYQLSMPQAGALEKTAEAALRQTRDFQTADITERKAVTFAGTSGVKLSGTHTHANGATKRFVQYVAIGPERRFVRVLATANPDAFSALEPAIEAIAASVSFK